MNNLEVSNRHVAFIENVIAGQAIDLAAKKAGFSHGSRDAYPVLGDPKVRQYIRKTIRGRAETEGLSAAYDYLITVIRDESNDKRLRLDAAKFLYSQAVPAPKAQEAASDEAKAASEMSNEELRQFIEQSENELANRATPINPPPVSNPPQGIDLIL